MHGQTASDHECEPSNIKPPSDSVCVQTSVRKDSGATGVAGGGLFMKKIFTDSDIYEDVWFRDLPPEYKLLWEYICRRCQYGIWKPDFKLAEFMIGGKLDEQMALELLNNGKDRIEVLKNGCWFVIDFCQFQYGGLQPQCAQHKHALKFFKEKYPELLSRVGPRVGPRVKDQDQDQDKDKENKWKPTLNKLKEYFGQLGFLYEAEKFFDHFSSNGWRVGGKAPMKDWKAAARNWCRRNKEQKDQPSKRDLQRQKLAEKLRDLKGYENG